MLTSVNVDTEEKVLPPEVNNSDYGEKKENRGLFEKQINKSKFDGHKKYDGSEGECDLKIIINICYFFFVLKVLPLYL